MTRSQQLACMVGVFFLAAGSLYLVAFRDAGPMAVVLIAVVILFLGSRG